MANEIASYSAEAVGTFALVFTIGCNLVQTVPSPLAGVSIAAVLMVLVYCFGTVSGAHLNPAVTLAIKLKNGAIFPWSMMIIYMSMQVLGGILAGLAYSSLFGETLELQHNSTLTKAGMVEMAYTFMLCFVVVNVTDRANDGNEFFGIAIGFVIVAGAYAGGWISGGAFNPAVAVGLDASAAFLKGTPFGMSMSYSAFQFGGAVLAAIITRMMRDPTATGGASLAAKCIAEFVGVFFLVFTIGLNVTGHTPSPVAVLSIASALMVMIFSVGDVSGAHLNPAVTAAILFAGRGKLTRQEAVFYFITQITAGLVGALAFRWMTKDVASVGPQGGFTVSQALIMEGMFTFVLAHVVLAVATSKQPLGHMFGFAIGMCVVVGGYAIGGVSGGHLNPAVSIGLDAVHAIDNGGFKNSLFWSAAQIVGGGGAATVFYMTRGSEYGGEGSPWDSQAEDYGTYAVEKQPTFGH